MASTAVTLRNITKSYGDDLAVNNLSLSVEVGEVLALVGPSGCGKTTTLRLIAGFERPDAGEILIGDTLVAGSGTFTPPEERGVGMVFQDYALFPHLTVFDNVAFGLQRRPEKRVESEVNSMLSLVGLDKFAGRYPHELSGGQRQRVALARAMAPRPMVILLDEPFSNLDADRRLRMREEVRVILRGFNTSAIFVTHDQEEALYMGDRVGVIRRGGIEQIGAPEEVYQQPATRFVAEFMGNTDFLPGEVVEGGIQTEIGLIPQKVDLPEGAKVELAVRADDVAFEPTAGAESLILARHYKGAYNIYRLRLPSGQLLHAMHTHVESLKPGTPVRVWINAGHPLACFHEGRAIVSG